MNYRHRYLGWVLVGVLELFLLISCGKKSESVKSAPIFPLHPALAMKPVPRGLGVNIHFYEGLPQDWQMLSEAGVGIVRMDAGWSAAEKVPGQYDFSRYDTLVARLERRHMRLLFILDYGNPLYDDGLAPHSDSARVASAKFFSAVAARYRGKPILYELWNEPNLSNFWRPKPHADAYLAWAKAVSDAIRRVDPNACILGPAMSGIRLDFMRELFSNGYLNWVDGVSVHPYRSPQRSPETALPEYEMLRVLIEQYKPKDRTLPIVSGEWGYTTVSTPKVLQAKYLARQWLTNLSFGIPISIWYDWHDDGQDPNNSEHHFGTVTWDYKPKPAFRAMKTLIAQLRGFHPVARIGLGRLEDFVVPFYKGRQIKLAVWTTGSPHRLDLGEGIHIARAVNFEGKPRQFWGLPKVRLTNAPLYLTLSRSVPRWLSLCVRASALSDSVLSDVLETVFSHKTPQTDFGRAFLKAFRDGSVKEHRTALHILVQLGDRLRNRKKAVTLYRFVLNQDPDTLDVQAAIYGLAARQLTDNIAEITRAEKVPELRSAVAAYRFFQVQAFLRSGQTQKAFKNLLPVLKSSLSRRLVNDLVEQLEEKGKIPADSLAPLTEKAGFVDRWWVVGPFPNEKNRGQITHFPPEKKVDLSAPVVFRDTTLRWQKLGAASIQGIVPFARLFGRKRGVAYAYAELNLPKSRWVQFKIGSNDGVVCWVNGKKVHENFVGRGLTIDEDAVTLRLKKGKNKILLKVLNHGANWEACLRVCSVKGIPLDISRWVATPGY